METHRDKYKEYMLKTKGFSIEHVEQCQFHLGKFAQFLHEKNVHKINEVTREHLDQFQEKVMRRKELKNTSKISILAAIRSFFKFLYNYDLIEENLSLMIEVPKRGTAIPRNIMNDKEITYF